MIGSSTAVLQTLLTANLIHNLRSRIVLRNSHALGREGVGEGWTLAIPVRNEENNLRELLPQIVDQRFRPQRVVFLDDQSEDGTRALIETYASKHPWIEVQAGEALGVEWRGKVWALHQLLRAVETPYVVFMDADVRLCDGDAFASLWGLAESLGFGADAQTPGFFSLFPRTTGPWQAGLLMDQVPVHLYYFLPFFRKYFRVPGAVAGCGQLMLARTKELHSMGGFARLRHSTHDGLGLARLYQGAGRKVFAVDGREKFSVKMYSSFPEAFRGFSRNSLEADASLPVALGMSAMLFWGFVMPYFLWPLFLANPLWLASFLYYLYGQQRLASEMQWPVWSLATTPVRAGLSIGVHLWGAARGVFGVTTEWKGRVLR